MELTKEQIKKIDNRLKRKGINYWDLRIEMVDHIVSDIEENATSNDFKVALEKSLDKLGWRGSLHKQNQEGWQNVNRKYRREYAKEILHFIKSIKNMSTFIFFSFVYYLISKHLNFDDFKKLSLAMFLVPLVIFLFLTTKQLMKKYGKSVNVDYGMFYFLFPFLMINFPLQLIKEFTEDFQKISIIIIVSLFWVFSYIGYKVYRTAITVVEKMKKELTL
ncbi:hypothetical protein P8625_12040 [Tenacibaculum tangerinum]|uniref:Uncharacterized protein n=1 Tax=Tenacibaculum tangerinum TaxID=3038772 RepID=A0ABY8L374_9FLAO|nr:hypothetical protein [Tenacibaculum tangerinum]WGH74808.1 hypothetical protein P8625_12040 [Tenacibaculum tangerinum]